MTIRNKLEFQLFNDGVWCTFSRYAPRRVVAQLLQKLPNIVMFEVHVPAASETESIIALL